MNYVQITDAQRRKMLDTIGVESIEQLFGSLPDEYRLHEPLQIPAQASELELRRQLRTLGEANRTTDQAACFMGCGAYDHFIPAVVDDLAHQGEFLTAYTPYQAEASQGGLQAFFEFQTQVARLSGMEIANASLYEGATSVSEAVYMALNVTGKRRVLVASTIHPHYRAVLRTACEDLPVEVIEIPTCSRTGVISREAIEEALDHDTACVLVQSPNVYGLIEDWEGLFEATHEQQKTLAVGVFNPVASALLKSPGACGADVAAGEGQPLGIPMAYGGPYLGLFATKKKLMRKMPGRLVGQSTDEDGRRGFCLTLQTREQHIRGAKATSNICTNQGLLAMRATVHISAMGPQGLREAATQSYHKAHHVATQIAKLEGYELAYPQTSFFHEFVVNCPLPASKVVDAGIERGVLPGVELQRLGIGDQNQLLVTVTEKRTSAEIAGLVEVMREVG